MPSPDQLLGRHRAVLARHRAVTAAVAARAWGSLASHDEDDITTFEAMVGPTIAAAHEASVASTTAFLAVLLGTATPPVTAAAVPVGFSYRDPFTTHWHALAEGRPFQEALQAGRSAAEAAAGNFVQSTARRAGDAFTAATGETFRWRRVAEPTACTWCSTRSGNTYRTASAADFGHSRCFCDVVPDT